MRRSPAESDSIPIVTWVILAAAVALFAAAIVVGASGSNAGKPTSGEQGAATSESPAREGETALPETSRLSITAELLDAESRSHLWNQDASIATIQTLIGPGGTKTPIEFEFGVPKGTKLPGTPLGAERLAVLYSNGRAVQSPRNGKAGILAAGPPNCPLEIAAKKTPLGQLKDESVAVLYSYSKKHGRPIWHFTDNAGSVHRIDGNSCAVLLH